MKIYVMRAAFALALLLFWQFASGRLVSDLYISSPVDVFWAFLSIVTDGSLFRHAAITATEALGGFVLGGAAGFVAGVILGRAQMLADVLDPFILAFYSLPKIALAPLFVMWFGIDIGMKVIFAAAIVFLLVFMNTYAGVRSVSRELVTIYRLMGATERQVVSKVVIPSAITWVFAGLRLSVPYALVGAIIGELIAANRGLGYLLSKSTSQFDTAGAFAALIAIVVLSVTLNLAIKEVEKRLMPWREAEAEREVSV